MEKGNYRKFFFTLLISYIVMYAIMYLDDDRFDTVYLNLTRFYMTLIMISAMALIMLGMMRMMYQNRKTNTIITFSALIIFVFALIGVRNQAGVGDVQYLKGMIPHHSIAIMTSKHADIKDPAVKKLSKEIIASQEKEIGEMKQYLKRLDR
jgi:uncharacterized protein (DUF305 family)